MSKHEYPLEILCDELELLQGNIDRYDPKKQYYEDDDLTRWKRQVKELKTAIDVLGND